MAVKARDQVTVAVAVDVASVDNYYKLQSSTATPPTKPTTANPSGWSTTEPTYDGTSTNTLYICQKTTLTDGTFYWSAVSKSTSYEAAKTAYNLANSTSEALDDKADKTDGVEYISGTQAAATGTWTGVTKDSALYDGKVIVYHLPVVGSGDASLVLTLSGGTDTDAIPIFHYYSTSSNTSTIQRVTTHYPAGSSVLMTYDATNVRWLISNYNTNVNQIDRTQHSNNLRSASANNTGKTYVVTASSVIGYVDTLSGYQTIIVGSIIDLSKPILWGTGNVAVNKTFTNAYETYPSCTLRNNVSGWTGTQYATAYLRGTVNGQNMTVESITSTIPSVEDGYVYLPLGELYSTYQIAFRSSSKLYVYKDGAFGPTSIREAAAAAKTATNYISLHPTDGIKIADANPATATTYQHQTATSTEFVVEGESMLEMGGNGVRIGKADAKNMQLTGSGMSLYSQEGIRSFNLTTTGQVHVSTVTKSLGSIDRIFGGMLQPDQQKYFADWTFNPGGSYASMLDATEINLVISTKSTFTDETQPYASDSEFVIASVPETVDDETTTTVLLREYLTIGVKITRLSSGLRFRCFGENYTEDNQLATVQLDEFTKEEEIEVGYPAMIFGRPSGDFTPGAFSVSLGNGSKATGSNALAEGVNTLASGSSSHAEGCGCIASAESSHASGWQTIASSFAQMVIGSLNVENEHCIFIIGNGFNGQGGGRSNAFVVDYEGRVDAANEIFQEVSETTCSVGSAAASIAINDVKRAGNVVTVTLATIKLAATLAAGAGTGTIATIPSRYRPNDNVYFPFMAYNQNGVYGYARITSSGAVTLRNTSTTTISKTAEICFTATYVKNLRLSNVYADLYPNG